MSEFSCPRIWYLLINLIELLQQAFTSLYLVHKLNDVNFPNKLVIDLFVWQFRCENLWTGGPGTGEEGLCILLLDN